MIYDKIKVRFWSQLWRWQKGDGSMRLSELFWEVMNFPADFLLSIFLL